MTPIPAHRPQEGGRERLQRRKHPGPRGPRPGPPTARHVHRLDRRPRPAPPRLGSRRQLDRRGHGRPRHPRRGPRPRGRLGPRDRRRPRRSGRAATRAARTPSRSSTPSSMPAASSAAAATRSRAVCTASASASSTRCPSGCASNRRGTASVWVQEYARGVPTTPVRKVGPQGDRKGTTTIFKADPTVFETVEFSFDTIAQRLRESAYLNKGLWIRLLDDRVDRERSFYFEGGLVSFVRHLNKNKETLHARPIYVERREGSTVDRGRAPVQRLLRGERLQLRQQHQHGRRRHPPDRLPRGADPLAQRLRPPGRHPQGQRRQPLRRRRPRRPDRGHQRQAGRPAVRRPDQGQARQRRGQGPGRGRGRRGHRPVPRREPGRRPPHHREVADRRARPRGRPQGPRPRHPQGRPRGHVAAGQAGRLPGARPRQERALHRRGRLGRRLGQAGPRPPLPGDPAAARQAPQRREGAPGQDRLEREHPAARHRAGRRHRRLARPGQAPLPPDHHHDRRRRGRRPHPDPAADLLLPAHAAGHRERLPLHRPAAALPRQHRQGDALRLSPRRSGTPSSRSWPSRTSPSSASRASAR